VGGVVQGTWSCPSKTTGCTGLLAVTFGCNRACDCAAGQVCCGLETGNVATTSCQTVASGGACPGGATGAQLCAGSSECANGQACTAQSCAYGANLSLCGIQSQSPFNCSAARDAAAD
jgi:hypothetical protein